MAAAAFDSGSTGADGAFNPLVDTQVVLPPDGVLNYTDVNIPAGVTVTFQRNATNTPVTILASGNVTIAGSIVLNGGHATDSGAAGDGNLGDDGLPGLPAPGGFAGGRGGTVANPRGGNGLGPGGGSNADASYGGGGGGFGAVGASALFRSGFGGPIYGAATLLPLIGGSGGAGGGGGSNFAGAGGGGGGGAIMIAATGTVAINGAVLADGGLGGSSSGAGGGYGGGGGSGGGIRIVATTIQGNGSISAIGGPRGSGTASRYGGSGAVGRIRFEAENFLRTAATNPAFTFAAPGEVFVAGMPALSITSVAGVAAPAEPTGNADITLATGTPNPVTVAFHASGVPVGNTVTLTVLPANAAPLTAVSDALAGTDASSTASASVNLPDGPSVLQATVSFTVTAAIGDALKNYAKGERVERIELAAASGAAPLATLITVSGKRYVWSGGRAIN